MNLSVEVCFSDWAPDTISNDVLIRLANHQPDWLKAWRFVASRSFAVDIADINSLPLLDKLLTEVCRHIQQGSSLNFTICYRRLVELDGRRIQSGKAKDLPGCSHV